MLTPMTDAQLTAAIRSQLDQLDPAAGQSHFNVQLRPSLVSCDGASNSLILSFPLQPWMSNPVGVLHGGLSAAMADTAMGMTCRCRCDHHTPTISLTLNYARPIPLGSTVHIRTHLVTRGATIAQATAEFYLPDQPDRILLSAVGVYSVK